MDATMILRACTLLALGTALLPGVAHATVAGQTLFVKGEVTAERQPPVPLAKGDDVLVSDTVRTGIASRAQLLMVDGARIAIRPESVLRIEEYSYTPDDAGSSAVQRADRSVTSLVKGGFRTITGAIGKDNEEEYEVRTAVGVLGIRGTDYQAVFCNGDCVSAPGATSTPIEDGLYLGCADGILVFRNEFGEIEIRAGQYAFIPLTTRQPVRLDRAPAVLVDLPEEGASRGGQGFNTKLGARRQPAAEDSAPGADPAGGREPGSAPEQPKTGTNADGSPIDLTPGQTPTRTPPTGTNRTIAAATGPLAGYPAPVWTGVRDNTAVDFQEDADGQLVDFTAPVPVLRTGNEDGRFTIGGAQVLEATEDPLTFMRWGRWSAGTANVNSASGGDTPQELDQRSIHFIESARWNTPPVMPITGTASYTLIGSTSPTDNNGNVGVLGNATFDADFTNQQVTSTLDLTIAQQRWQATGTGNLGPLLQPAQPAHLFQGTYNAVIIDGVTGGSGVFSGFFSEPGPTSDPNVPGGVGLSYSLTDPNLQTTVSGTAAFGNP